MAKQKVDLLYEAASQEYDLGTRDEFVAKLQDPNKRKALYEAIGEQYQLGTFDEFSNKVVEKKKPVQTSGLSGSAKPIPSGSFITPKSKGQSYLQKPVTEQLVGNKPVSKNIPALVASKSLQKQNGIVPKEQFSNLGELNKEVVQKSTSIAANQQESIKKATGDPKGMLEAANDVFNEVITSGTASVVSGLSGLVGGAADLMINKKPNQKSGNYTFLSDEWLHEKFMNSPLVQQGEVSDPSWWSTQAIRDKFIGWSNKLSEVAQGESETAKMELGVTNTKESGVDDLLQGNYKDFAKKTLVDIGTQIPQLVAMYATGGSNVALAGMGASSAGSDMTRQYNQDQDVSLLDAGQSVAIGTMEAVAEKILGTDITAANIIGKKLSSVLGTSGKALQQQIRNEGVDAVKSKLIRSFGEVLSKGAKGAGEEAFEENLVSVVSFLVDAIDEDKINQKGFEQLGKDMIQNTLVSGAIGGSMSYMAAQASFKPLTKEEKMKIGKYQEVLDSETASNEVKKIAKAKLEAINSGTSTKAEANYDKIMELPLDQRVLVMDKMNKVKDLEAEYETLSDMDMKDSVIERITQLDEEINLAMDPKLAEAQGTQKGIEAAANSTTKLIEQSDKIQAIEARMNNAEYIDEKDINSATDELYILLDEVDNSNATPEIKQGIVSAIENKIKKLESYEFETTSQVTESGQTKAVSRGVQIIGTTTRGSKSKNAVTGERLNKKSVTAVDGTTGETMDGEFVFVDGKLDIIDRKAGTSKVFDTGRLEYTETNLDEDGVVQSITLSDPTTGDVFTINDPEIALDLSIQEKTKQLGEITDGVLEEVIQEVEVAPVVKTTVKNKQTISNPAPSVLPNIPVSSTPTATTSTTSNTATPTSSKPTTPEEAAKESEKMYQDSEEAVLKSGKKNYWALFKKLVGNRKTNIEKIITTTEKGVLANAAVENVSGSMSYADEQFMDARKRLYARALMKIDKRFGKMSIKVNQVVTNIDTKAKQALEEIILHRRIIEIDSRTDKKNKKLDAEIAELESKKQSTNGTLAKAKVIEEIKKLKDQRKPRIKHPRGFNKELSEAAIEGIKKRLGTESFNDIEKRVNTYFEIRGEILDKAVNEGLISKDSAYNLTGDDYVERRFLEYILEDHKTYGQSNSLSSAQIKSLSEGSTGLVLMDSEVLLHSAYRSIENRIAQNRANRALSEAVSEQKFDKSVVIPAEFQKNLNGKYKTDKYGNRVLKTAPNGFELIPFYENGEKSGVFMRTNEASEWNDSVKIQVMIGDINFDNALKTVLFVKTLKFFATLANPLFAYGNMFRDFAKVLFLSSTYDNNILTAAPRLLANFSGKVAQYTALKTSGIASDDFRQLIDDYTKYGGKFEFLHRDGKSSNLYKNTLNKKRYLISKIGGGAYNLFENAMGLPGEISEISMRLAVFEKTRDTLIDKYGGKSKVNNAQMADINLLAANASRAIMDYNKGGLATKWLDNFSPYLNASVVGFVSDVNYIKKNPKQFAAKMGAFGLNVAAITLWNLMNSDEEDRKNIPQYIKDNNFIFFVPGKNKDGKKNYGTIPKYQGLQPFAAMFEESTEIVYNMYMGKPQKSVGEIANRLQETVSTWSPIPASMRGLMLKMPPLLQASFAYKTNYDLFRDSKIEYREGKVLTKDEGLDNDKTARIYRVLGQMSSKLGDNYTISPSRSQNFTEKLITSPSTNFIVGNVYGIADWVTQEYQIPREIKEAKPSTTKASVKNKFVKEVDPEYLSKFKAKSNTIEKEINSESEFQQKTIKLMVSNGEPTDKIIEFIKGLDTSPEVKVTRLKKAADLIATKNDAKTVPYYGELMDVKYIDGLTFPTPEDRATKAFDRFGGVDPNSEDFPQIIESAKKLKVITKGDSETRFLKEYYRLFQKNQPEGKQK